jgi:arylsulfatase A-like enzyme/Flp pilus assembly protein TadD
MKSLFAKVFILLILFVIAGWAIWLFSDSTVAAKDIRNVLLISIDTCRADYLGCYGYQGKTTPNIDAIADEAVLFENVISPIPLTLPAHSSMLTGTIPPYHRVHDNLNDALDESNVTLAEVLKDNGFTTGAIISAMVMDSRFGVSQGFDTYNDEFENEIKTTNIKERRGDETSRFAVEWLDENKHENFFMFLHYYDPHHLYEPPEPFASEFQDDLYAGEIAYTDHCIGLVLDKLRKLGLYDSTLIIITGDHGEMLKEHGEPTHGYFIYQSAIKVPLIFKMPPSTKPKRIKDAVGLIDIMPTICSLLGVEILSKVHGIDLSAYIKGNQTQVQNRPIFCESLVATKYHANSLLGVVTDRWKYIQTTRSELYDIIKDPQESDNLVLSQPQQARILQDHLQQILEQSVRTNDLGSKPRFDEQTIEELKSLGYVGGSVNEDFTFDQAKDDPKDLLDFHNDVGKVQALIFNEKYDRAKSLCEKLIAQRPQVCELHYNMARIAMKQEDFDSAIPYLQHVIKLKADLAPAHKDLADVLKSLGRLDESVLHYLEAIKIKSDYADAHFNLARMYYELAKSDLAVEHFRQTLQINPDFIKARINLANTLLELRRIEPALKECYRILEAKPDRTHFLNIIAWIRATSESEELRDPEEAVQLATKACEVTNYENVEILNTLAAAFASADRFDDAVQITEKAIKLALSNVNKELAEKTQKRLQLYKLNRPYYDSALSTRKEAPNSTSTLD